MTAAKTSLSIKKSSNIPIRERSLSSINYLPKEQLKQIQNSDGAAIQKRVVEDSLSPTVVDIFL